MTAPSERRIEPRIPVRIHMRYRVLFSPDGASPESELHNGNNVVFNISRGGFFLTTKNFFEIGSRIQIEFPLDPVQATVRGIAAVVRANNYNYPSQGHYEYGLQFSELGIGSKEYIEKFVKMTK